MSEHKFWKHVYTGGEAHWTDKDVSRLAKRIVKDYSPLGKVLEIGSAAGIDTFYLAKHAKEVEGVDIVREAVALSEKNLAKEPAKIQEKVNVSRQDAENLKFKDDYFDLVYSLSVLHSTDIEKSIPEVYRVLKPGGHAVLYVFLNEDEGGTQNGITKKEFKTVCREYFEIEDQEEHTVEEDDGGDSHEALILYLKKEDLDWETDKNHVDKRLSQQRYL